MTKKRLKLSPISLMHCWKLVFRSGLLIWALVTYAFNPELHGISFAEGFAKYRYLLYLVWIIFAVEMVLRFFPAKTESMGCQKQFAKNFRPAKEPLPPDPRDKSGGSLLPVILSWLALNGALGGLYLAGILDDACMLMLVLFYAVSDMICILFFCPFQSWMMHNRCCTTCRIYNWDYLMMFTPFLFIPTVYTWSLGGMALLLFIRWEVTAKRHPEFFREEDNESLRCAGCKERLCIHKTQLHHLWKQEMKQLEAERDRLEKRLDEIYQSIGKPRNK